MASLFQLTALLNHVRSAIWSASGRTWLRKVDFGSLEFPIAPAEPDISVIIPTYGHVEFTLRCLVSIARNSPSCGMEIIVVEDASGDPNIDKIRLVSGIVFCKNPQNLGFLRSCNGAASIARGKYLLFLNSDTEVLPGAVDALVELARTRPDAGLIGSKLVYPDGRLQEAGGIVWSDASAWNYGRFDDPGKPEYNYVREVDYISGASILVPRQVWGELGGFDETFAPAYYEDTDLAFRIRGKGLKVLYQPRSVVIHHEGISHGTDIRKGVKANQARNQKRFRERWGVVLDKDHFASGQSLMRARDGARARTVILVVDHYVPEPDRDAGSKAMLNTLRALVRLGWIVKFWPQNLAYTQNYVEPLQQMGIEVRYGSSPTFPQWLEENGPEIDYVLLSRPTVAPRYLPDIKRLAKAKTVYYGHDLHFARMRLQAQLGNHRRLAAKADAMERTERAIWRAADLVLYFSQEEVDTVRALEKNVNVRAVRPYCFDTFAIRDKPPMQALVLFVAGFQHPPNVDAAIWFVREILPHIRMNRQDVSISLVGSHPTNRVSALAGDGIKVTGFVSKETLAEYYASARVGVVPLRFGAGVKLKVVEAMQAGLPLVTTPIGAQGLPGIETVCSVHANPQEFAQAVLKLLNDEEAWKKQSALQTAYVRRSFSCEVLTKSVADAFQI